MERPLYSPSMNFLDRNINSRSLALSEGLPPPPYDISLPPILTAKSGGSGSPGQLQPQNVRPFKCDQCPQSFYRNLDLKRHKRIHLTVKPFPCGHCEKSFSRKDALKRHILVKGCGGERYSRATGTDSEEQNGPEMTSKESFEDGAWVTGKLRNNHGKPQFPIELPGAGNMALISTPILGHLERNITKISSPGKETPNTPPCTQNKQATTTQLKGPQLPSSADFRASPTAKNSQTSHPDSSPGYDTLTSITDEETDWSENESTDARVYNLSKFGEAGWERKTKALVQPLLSPFKKQLIERIMNEFWTIFNQENETAQASDDAVAPMDASQGPVTQTFAGVGNSSNALSQTPSTCTAETSQHKTGKGNNKRGGDDQDDQEGNDGEEKTPKRPRTLLPPPQSQDDNSKFACPYRKRDSRKYCVQHWRSCALTPLDTVARVKGHLYRHHRIFPCRRCKTLFENQDAVNFHVMELKACELKDTVQSDGITSEIYEKLRSKKKAQRNQTEAERWKDIYKLLFPNEMIPSPYFEPVQEDLVSSPNSRELADYEDYCRRELPRDFRAALEEIVHHESQPLEESIRNQLMNIIRDCQDRVFTRYRSSAIVTAGTPSTTIASQEPTTKGSAGVPNTTANSSFITAAPSESPLGRDYAPFFKPPTPQHHLQSRLEVPDSQNAVSKTTQNRQQSDSGYGSNTSTLQFSPTSTFSNSIDGAPLSMAGCQVSFESTTDHLQSMICRNNVEENDGTGTAGTLYNMWMNYESGIMEEGDWNTLLDMESSDPAPD